MDEIMSKKITKSIAAMLKENNVSIDDASGYLENCRINVLTEILEDKANTIYVIKKSGKVQDFNEDKLFSSIAGASDDVHEPLNDSDLKVIVKNVIKKMIEKKQKLYTTNDIRKYVLEILKEMSFIDVSKKYTEYEKD